MTDCMSSVPDWQYEDHPEVKVGKSKCEADKTLGTRDPDKFLREQQDAIWREIAG